jgi:UDP-N-acetylmuramate--alanine ligase
VRDLFEEFSDCFRDADAVIVTPLYSAGEPPIDGINHRSLAHGIVRTGHKTVIAIENEREIATAIKQVARPGDMVICLGAGHSTDWAHALPQWLADGQQRLGSAM